jgi:putative Mg2+ transporter-C (MgtC) family protein
MIDILQFYVMIAARLILACILGGLIGFERENTRRPAGFRTHILVCTGSALVMLTSEFIFRRYSAISNIDPGRLGAQVISGIGFLGAGTIIREGFSVKGLTTAASLWAVSCVGIAVGIGFYEGAIAATILIYVTLIVLKRFEGFFIRRTQTRYLYVETADVPGQIGAVSNTLVRDGIEIRKIELLKNENNKGIIIKVMIKMSPSIKWETLLNDLKEIEGVQKVLEP